MQMRLGNRGARAVPIVDTTRAPFIERERRMRLVIAIRRGALALLGVAGLWAIDAGSARAEEMAAFGVNLLGGSSNEWGDLERGADQRGRRIRGRKP